MLTVLTGASSGIGAALVPLLADAGHDLILSGRDAARLAESAAVARAKGRTVTALPADLSTIAGARAFADAVRTHATRIDVLIHCAGILPTERVLTRDGFEESFAVNHLAPFILNGALKDRLHAGARIIQVSAGMYVAGSNDLETGPTAPAFHPFKTYGTSKLWNLLATLELARTLDGVTVNAVHPGVVRTRLGDMRGWKGALLSLVKRLWWTPERGARAPFALATDAAYAKITGAYFDQNLAQQPLHAVAARDGLGRDIVARTEALLA